MSRIQNMRDPATLVILNEKILKKLENFEKISENFERITVALEKIAQIDHNHVEGKIHTHEDKW